MYICMYVCMHATFTCASIQFESTIVLGAACFAMWWRHHVFARVSLHCCKRTCASSLSAINLSIVSPVFGWTKLCGTCTWWIDFDFASSMSCCEPFLEAYMSVLVDPSVLDWGHQHDINHVQSHHDCAVQDDFDHCHFVLGAVCSIAYCWNLAGQASHQPWIFWRADFHRHYASDILIVVFTLDSTEYVITYIQGICADAAGVG